MNRLVSGFPSGASSTTNTFRARFVALEFLRPSQFQRLAWLIPKASASPEIEPPPARHRSAKGKRAVTTGHGEDLLGKCNDFTSHRRREHASSICASLGTFEDLPQGLRFGLQLPRLPDGKRAVTTGHGEDLRRGFVHPLTTICQRLLECASNSCVVAGRARSAHIGSSQ